MTGRVHSEQCTAVWRETGEFSCSNDCTFLTPELEEMLSRAAESAVVSRKRRVPRR